MSYPPAPARHRVRPLVTDQGEIMTTPGHLRDRMLEPIKAYGNRKFRDISLVEQHEVLFRFIEETYDEVMEIKELLLKKKEGEE